MFYLDFPGLYPWQRAGRHGNIYFDRQLGLKQELGYAFIKAQKMQNLEQMDGPIGAVFVFYKKYPVKFPKSRRGEVCFWATKPDCDNLEKILMDIAQTQAQLIREDSRICAKMSIKLYGSSDHTAIILGRWQDGTRFNFDGTSIGFGGCNWDLLKRDFI